MNHYRRNADEASRRRERARIGVDTQESIDRSVIDKMRAGRPGQITLHELQRCSPGLIPREVYEAAFQGAFGKLWGESEHAHLDVLGADLTITAGESSEDPAVSPADAIVFLFDTPGLDPRFVFTNAQIPRVRFWLNNSYVESDAYGNLVPDQ